MSRRRYRSQVASSEIVELFLVLGGVALFTGAVLLMLRTRADDSADAHPGTREEREPQQEPERVPEPFAADPDDRPRAAIVVNPTKFDDLDGLYAQVEEVCEQQGWAKPLWLETTAEDPGQGPTRQAMDEGVELVLACGGDGTVRAVAEALAGSDVAMGLLPAGTGNLLARNLDVSVTDIAASAKLALTGGDHPVDVGRLVLDSSGEDERPREHVFCVMAGLGFDATIMANAPEALKARVGWLAYVVSGMRHLKGKSSRVRITIDGKAPLSRRIRTVVVGNCGKLTGGLVLMPDARVDDGWIDVVSIAPRGLAGWVGVAGQVLTRRRKGHHRVEHFRCREVVIQSENPEQVQIDGDPIGEARVLRIRIDPGALRLRVLSDDQV